MESTQNPEVRVRINYDSTIKDGWRFESTIEVSIPSNDPEKMEQLLTQYGEIARRVGFNEVAERNKLLGRF